ncbi:hypothetical protein GALMADRAFT_142358 [Galerina marginata CBS 339.88]|uniref:NmrA-like domain-containing protein n=1 Tax=Galerina marginata (strain CBS 339.88) TaxID=685588 RepID=A0A067SQI5_GALM3|nr:hypothetical protein GALMADRAFT_142358 [Galerina marginata CBS 339.88]
MSDQSSKIIVVVGATGQQGGGVLFALLAQTSFQVIGLTRTPDSEAALALTKKHGSRLKMMAAEVFDADSLKRAFKGAYGVFAVTQWQLPIQIEKDNRYDLIGGFNLVDAALACGIQHFVYSGMPNMTKFSGGRYTKVFHFDYKAQVEEYALAKLGSMVPTFLHPSLFYANLNWKQYCKRAADGVVEFRAPLSPNKKACWVDPYFDVGAFASAVFVLGPAQTAGKTYPIQSPPCSQNDLAATYTLITGEPARAAPTSISAWGDTVSEMVGEGFRDDIEQMMLWMEEAQWASKADCGTMDHVEYEERKKELGGLTGSTFEEYLKRTDWRKSYD